VEQDRPPRSGRREPLAVDRDDVAPRIGARAQLADHAAVHATRPARINVSA
jgi:hypothetical protein